MPYLLQRNPDGSVNQFWNLHDSPTTVGRSDDVNAHVQDRELSSQHFVITEGPDGFTLKDMGTTNGTFVNGQRVAEQKLKPGDTIRAGRTEFAFMEGLTTLAMKIDQDIKDLERMAVPPPDKPTESPPPSRT